MHWLILVGLLAIGISGAYAVIAARAARAISREVGANRIALLAELPPGKEQR